MTFAQGARERLQQHLNDSIGDKVTFKLHDGDPGPNLTDNLACGDGLPQDYDYRTGGDVVFDIPKLPPAAPLRVPAPRRWWHLRPRYREIPRSAHIEIHAVSLWVGETPWMHNDLHGFRRYLCSGDAFQLTNIERPKIQ